MSRKINVDYFRNKFDKLPDVQLPHMKLPKIKSRRKIFSTKGPNENMPPPLPKEPPPSLIVDRSPVTISTISQMVDGAPIYDYSFGGAQVSDEVFERHKREDETASNQGAYKDYDKPAKSNLKFSEKLTKHYKELSEFKFKNILGKKTVVKTTTIQVDDYKRRYEEEKNDWTSDNEDYDFDVDSLPPISGDPSRRCSETTPLDQESNESRRGSESGSVGFSNPSSRRGSETASNRWRRSLTEIPLKSESLHNLHDLDELEEVPPNESSLYRIKERSRMSGSTSAVAIDIESPSKDIGPTPSRHSKRSHRQKFDNACGKAKKAVNSKFQKLKQLRSKSSQDQPHDQQETAPAPKVPVRKSTYKKSVKKRPEVMKLGSVSSVHSEQESLGSFEKDIGQDLKPPRPEWVAKRILSTESKKDTPHLLRSQFKAQYSIESYDSEREVTVTRRAPPPPKPVAKLQLPGDEWGPPRPVSRLGIRSEDEWGPAPQISKLRQTSEDEWGPAPSISKLRQQSEDEWGTVPTISKFHQSSEEEWGPQPIVSQFHILATDEWGAVPMVSKLKHPPIDEWGPPPPLPKIQQPSLDEWILEPPLPELPLEWGNAPELRKVHQLPPDEWGPAPTLPKLQQLSIESEWGPTQPLPKVPQPSLEEELSPTITQKLQQQKSLDEWGPLPPPPNQTTVLVHKKSTFTETPKRHLRKPSMDSNDSDSWIPETYKNLQRQQSGLNIIEEIDSEPWSMKGVGAASSTAPVGCTAKSGLQKSIDIFSNEENGKKAFEDFDDALKNVPVIPIIRKEDTITPPLQHQSSFELVEHPEKPLIKETSLSTQFSDDIEAKNLDINVNKLITQFETFPALEIQKIQVIGIVETAELHYVNNSDTKPQFPNDTELDQLPKFPESQEQNTIAGTETATPNPSLESIRASRSRRISAKEWASKARATRSLESGAYASDEIFYSFEKDHHGVTPSSSPPQRLIKRQVYRVDL